MQCLAGLSRTTEEDLHMVDVVASPNSVPVKTVQDTLCKVDSKGEAGGTLLLALSGSAGGKALIESAKLALARREAETDILSILEEMEGTCKKFSLSRWDDMKARYATLRSMLRKCKDEQLCSRADALGDLKLLNESVT